MTKRLETLLSLIPQCGIFADIGCDHGYIANAMLLRRKCERVIVSDISAECLKKAETLLSQNFPDKFTAVVSDGFDNVGFADCALIAGMGGDIIVGKKSPGTTCSATYEKHRKGSAYGYRLRI